MDSTIIQLPKIADPRGNLSIIEQIKQIPFEIKSERASALEQSYAAFKKMRERAESGETPDLTMEEIDEEIRVARASR